MSIASELSTLAQNKASIKAAIESKSPLIPPAGDMSQWPTSVSSIQTNSVYEYQRPLDWPDLEAILAAHPASEKGYGYAYAMLVYGHYPLSPNCYIQVPSKQAGCRHYVTSWGLDEDTPNAQQTWYLTEEGGYSEYEWIVVYTDGAEDITLWGPNYSPYYWRWLLWFYSPGGTITTTYGFDGIVSMREITAKKIIGMADALCFGQAGETQRIDVETHQFSSTNRINADFVPYGVNNVSIKYEFPNELTDYHQAFQDVAILTSIDTSSWPSLSAAKNTNTMFKGIFWLKSLDLSRQTFENVTNGAYMFYNDYCLENLGTSAWTLSNLQNAQQMFDSCKSLKTLDTSNWHTGELTTAYNMFYSCTQLLSIDMSQADPTQLTSTTNMFAYCSYLKYVNLSSWTFSSVQQATNMFNYDYVLEKIDLQSFAPNQLTTTQNMFLYCYNLNDIDTSNWCLSSLKNVQNMFHTCRSLSYLNTSNWDMHNVITAISLFDTCISLQEIDMSNWCLSSVTSIGSMFNSCAALSSIIGSNTVAADGSINGSTAYWGNGPKITFYLNSSNLLTHDSLLFLMYWVPSISNNQTIQIGTTNKAKLTAEEIAIATAKGWSVT